MARTATNGSVAMARTGTNQSSLGTGRTPVNMRAGRATSAGSTATTTVGADSPAITAAATMLMEGIMSSGMGGAGGGQMAKGLTPQDGAGLGLGLTPLGGAASGMGGSIVSGLAGMTEQDQEEERRRRLEVIAGLIGERWGWVGQEGVERCARRIGFECLWEDSMGGETKRVLSIAGDGVLIEVELVEDQVADVGLSFPSSREEVGKWSERGATVLKKNLTRSEGDTIAKLIDLKPFVRNLQRLRRMDQLSKDSVNCFDAINGIFQSLERLYRHELKEMSAIEDSDVARHVLSAGNGEPQMHDNGYIGLLLHYWKKRLPRVCQTTPEVLDDNGAEELWSILFDCEECSAQMYPPVRISDDWISKDVRKPNVQDGSEHSNNAIIIDWLAVPAGPSSDSELKIPNVRFTAHFEPEVIVPLQLALQICDSVSWPINQSSIMMTTFESLTFADQDALNPLLTSPRVVERSAVASDSNTESRTMRFILYTQPEEYAQVLTEIPFKHPMEIVALLPILRQWTVVHSILRRSFTSQGPHNSSKSSNSPKFEIVSDKPPQEIGLAPQTECSIFQSLEDEFAEFLASPPVSTTQPNGTIMPIANGHGSARVDPFDVNVALTTSTPSPQFTVQFPSPKHAGKVFNFAFSIGLNGRIENISIDNGSILPQTESEMTGIDGENGAKKAQRLENGVKRVLELSEDLGMVIEWLCRKDSKS